MAVKTYSVFVQGDPAPFPCREDEPVLAAMLRSRKGPVFYGCCGGGCGICRMKITHGRCEAYKPMSRAHVSTEDQKNGIVLLCCVQPRSDLHLAPVKK